MSEIAAHQQPSSPAEHIATRKNHGRIPVPTRKGAIMDLHIELLIEASTINGVRVDAVIHGKASKRAPTKIFAVIFSKDQPQDEYPIPVLWIREESSAWIGVG